MLRRLALWINKEWEEARLWVGPLAAMLFLAVGLVMLASPEGGTGDAFFSLPLGIVALRVGAHLFWKHPVVTRIRTRRKWITLEPWTATILLSVVALGIGAVRVSLDSGPLAQLFVVYWGLTATMTVAFAARRSLFQVVNACGVPFAWRRYVVEPMARVAQVPGVIDPLGRILRKRKLVGWQLYAVALIAFGIVASSTQVLGWMGTGWWEPEGWGRTILLRSLFVFLVSVIIFPLALMQASRLEDMVRSLRRRAAPSESSRWHSFASFQTECYNEASRCQGFAYRIFIYVALAHILMTVLMAVLFALDTTAASPASQYAHDSPLRGVPLVLTLSGTLLILFGLLYFVLVVFVRGVLAIRWLWRSRSNFVFEVDELDDDGCGGFSALGDYAVVMIATPLILSMWTSFVAFRNANVHNISILGQIAELSPFYAFEIALVVVGTAIPLGIGHSILRPTLRNRLRNIDEALGQTKAVGNKEKERNLLKERRLVEGIPYWPINRRHLTLIVTAGALAAAAFSDLAFGTFRLFGAPEIGFVVSLGMITAGLARLLLHMPGSARARRLQ